MLRRKEKKKRDEQGQSDPATMMLRIAFQLGGIIPIQNGGVCKRLVQ